MRLGDTQSQSLYGQPRERLPLGHKLGRGCTAPGQGPSREVGGFTPDAWICGHQPPTQNPNPGGVLTGGH